MKEISCNEMKTDSFSGFNLSGQLQWILGVPFYLPQADSSGEQDVPDHFNEDCQEREGHLSPSFEPRSKNVRHLAVTDVRI